MSRPRLGRPYKLPAQTLIYARGMSGQVPTNPLLPGFEGYELSPSYYDEALAPPMTPRPQYARLLGGLEGVDLADLAHATKRAVDRRGVRFRSRDGYVPFKLDPIPRIFPREEWDRLAAGLVQRARALNAFAADCYGERRIVAAGRVPGRVLEGAEHFEPEMAGVVGPGAVYAGVLGFDLVRDSDGVLKVLEDNARTPSGLAYAQVALEAIDEVLPLAPEARLDADERWSALADVLRAAAPEGVEKPEVALLSDGPANSAWWEHEWIAAALEIPVVTLDILETRGDRLYARIDGRQRRLDVVYRRTDEDRIHDTSGKLSPWAEAVLGPLKAGRLSCVNTPGAGIADDKLVHAYVPEMIRFYLDEQPLLASVRTYDLAQPDQRAECIERIDEMVIKPRSGHGGHGVIVCAHAHREDRDRAARQIDAEPERYVAQELVALSRHPTAQGAELRPRHVDLRPFVLTAGDRVAALPGGLTRVAFAPGALVVNSSQDGGAKATWVLR